MDVGNSLPGSLPSQAKRRGLKSLALSDRHGHVHRVKVIKGLTLGLGDAAVDAVRKWTFKPGTTGGRPVDVIFNLTVTFTLDGSAQGDGNSSGPGEQR